MTITANKHQEHERRLVDALFDVHADIAPHQAFDQQEQNHAAVQNRNRQQVEDAQVQADPRRQFHQRRPALLLARA